MKKFTKKDVINRMKKLNLPYVICFDSYKNSNTDCWFLDPVHGRFKAKLVSVLQGRIRTHPMERRRRRKTAEEVNEKAKQKNKNLKLIKCTYKGAKIKCKWHEKGYGYFWSKPCDLLRATRSVPGHPASGGHRQAKTTRDNLMKKYGVENVMHLEEVFKKSSNNQNNVYIKYHWKTKKRLYCKGLWESKTVGFLNKNKMDYLWQVRIVLTEKKVYFCDLYLIDENKYVEIKGWHRPDFVEKWNLFYKKYPNSEIWDYKILKTKKII